MMGYLPYQLVKDFFHQQYLASKFWIVLLLVIHLDCGFAPAGFHPASLPKQCQYVNPDWLTE